MGGSELGPPNRTVLYILTPNRTYSIFYPLFGDSISLHLIAHTVSFIHYWGAWAASFQPQCACTVPKITCRTKTCRDWNKSINVQCTVHTHMSSFWAHFRPRNQTFTVSPTPWYDMLGFTRKIRLFLGQCMPSSVKISNALYMYIYVEFLLIVKFCIEWQNENIKIAARHFISVCKRHTTYS